MLGWRALDGALAARGRALGRAGLLGALGATGAAFFLGLAA